MENITKAIIKSNIEIAKYLKNDLKNKASPRIKLNLETLMLNRQILVSVPRITLDSSL